MPVQAVAVTFVVQQQQETKDQQVPYAVLAIILLLSQQGEGEQRYKTSRCRNICNMIGMAEEAYLCLRLLLFCCITQGPLPTTHSSPTAQLPVVVNHQAPDFSESKALILPVSHLPQLINFPPTMLWDYLVAHKVQERWCTLRRTSPSFLHHLMLISCPAWSGAAWAPVLKAAETYPHVL